MNVLPHFINGQHRSDHVRTQPVLNPATGRVTKEVALAGKETVEQAIAASQKAFPA